MEPMTWKSIIIRLIVASAIGLGMQVFLYLDRPVPYPKQTVQGLSLDYRDPLIPIARSYPYLAAVLRLTAVLGMYLSATIAGFLFFQKRFLYVLLAAIGMGLSWQLFVFVHCHITADPYMAETVEMLMSHQGYGTVFFSDYGPYCAMPLSVLSRRLALTVPLAFFAAMLGFVTSFILRKATRGARRLGPPHEKPGQ